MSNPLPTYLRQSGPDAEIVVRVVPKSSRNRFSGVQGDALKLNITAPPVEGAANTAVLKFIADFCDISPSMVRLKSGKTSRSKTFTVLNANVETLLEKIQSVLPESAS